eukprot:CAMPEP_0185582168 /NCGR_PEP_ID=MMETSP0434-20130131/20032_1 /TAXON_ID=626734 ORGANISM="Favella taraikaensis, Strain Fe Narragansett Bay" /NCGR_SAMPLE_ID=MMETSP0434 /ASSEMBLY_ACC=CAM_ASM_000379 /LENGTH=138 /DNA_ID=CAMNT_0028200919 /DNA_START=296 /DNA_END=712 /DNA_ORIENTATION=-
MTESLCLHLPSGRLLLIQVRSLEVGSLVGRDGAEYFSVSPDVEACAASHLLQLLARSIEESLFNLESELFEEVNFLIVEVVVVKDGKLFHASLHLGAEARVVLHSHVIVLAALCRLIDLLHVMVELLDAAPDLVAQTR